MWLDLCPENLRCECECLSVEVSWEGTLEMPRAVQEWLTWGQRDYPISEVLVLQI